MEAPPEGVSFETTKLAPGDARGSQRFGASVATNGAIVVVGAARDLENGSESGAAYVFQRVAGDDGWSETVKLVPDEASALDHFGGSAAVDDDGTTILLGAAGAEGRRGAAYVFVRATSNDDVGWTQQARLSPSSVPDGELQFGRNVALAGVWRRPFVAIYWRRMSLLSQFRMTLVENVGMALGMLFFTYWLCGRTGGPATSLLVNSFGKQEVLF